MIWEVFVDSLKFYLIASGVVVFFSLPLCLYFFKKRQTGDIFLLYVFGFLNFLWSLFVYASVNYFYDIRQFSLIFFSCGFVALELYYIFWFFKDRAELKQKSYFKLTNGFWFVMLWLLGFGIFFYSISNYWDISLGKYFNPGYGINNDFNTFLKPVKAFFLYGQDSGQLMTTFFNILKDTGYAEGGTYINVFFSSLFGVDPYFVYQKVLLFFYLINIFVVFYFGNKFFKIMSIFARIALIFMSVLSVFNYLSMEIINSSVVASSLAIPFVLFSVLWMMTYFEKKKQIERDLFLGLLFLALTAIVFLYNFYFLFFIIIFMGFSLLFYGGKWKTIKKGLMMGVVFVFCLLLPFNFVKILKHLTEQTADNSDINVFVGKALGNTIGFVNPVTAFSLWFSNPDYRFFEVTVDNLWLFFSLISPLFFLIMVRKISRKRKRIIVLAFISFVSLIPFTYWITKSPYQNVKALHVFSVAWPLLLFLILSSSLNSKKFWLRAISLIYIVIYSYFSFKSAIYANSYIGKPVVESNYELMKIEPEFCISHGNKLFLGRDELSSYFLLSCDKIYFYYDRFGNNIAFWEIIKLNEMSSLGQDCKKDDYKLTRVDYEGYSQVLVDKCFKFDNKDYVLVKEYESYDWYKIKKETEKEYEIKKQKIY